MKPLRFVFPLLACAGLGFSGCTNAEGRFRPPDPLGRLIFDALDPGPRRTSDAAYVGGPGYQDNYRQPGPDYIWVEGAYGRDASGRRVWVPAHWAPLPSR